MVTTDRPEIARVKEIYQEWNNVPKAWARQGWTSEEVQRKRFVAFWRLMTSPGPGSLITILDVGCGDGAFFNYFGDVWQNSNFRYTGLDVRPEAIQAGKEAFGRIQNVKFIEADILDYTPDRDYHFVIASGTFNRGYIDNNRWEPGPFYQRIDRMVELAANACIFNILHSVFPMPEVYKHLRVKHRLPMRVDLSYLDDDYTVYVAKKFM